MQLRGSIWEWPLRGAKKNYDLRVRPAVFQVGQQVLFFHPRRLVNTEQIPKMAEILSRPDDCAETDWPAQLFNTQGFKFQIFCGACRQIESILFWV